ncbi:MAG: alpha/beta hydrolase [Alphaproteobacteria bacterium]|nr:alpha/beta hydrolase [Alphaproteobacteria bacterium]
MLRTLTMAALMALSVSTARAEDVFLKTTMGLTLGANLELADGKSVADGVVLLTHGTLAHNKMEIIVALQETLKERGISTLAPTLGLDVNKRQGMYDCTVPTTHKHSDAMDEIGLWLDWLKGQGARQVVLAGHSRGGNQTAWFAARENDPAVSRVVLIAPATWNADDAAKGFAKTHKQDLKGVLTRAERMIEVQHANDLMKGVGVLYCPGADVTAASFVSYYRFDDRRHTPYLIPMIEKPVLVIAGSEDTVVTGLIDAVKPLADAGKAQLVVIDGADHFFKDLYAEDVADAIAEFLQ